MTLPRPLLSKNKKPLLAGIVLIVISNAIALANVTYNRTGEPSSHIRLTERELTLPSTYGFGKENSGIALKIDWRSFSQHAMHQYLSQWTPPDWFNMEKLKELGFDVSYPADGDEAYQYYRRQLNKDVLLVLEYDGATYQQAINKYQSHLEQEKQLLQQLSPDSPKRSEFEQRVDAAKKQLEQERITNTRLFVIDAGLDYDSLRGAYPDQSKYIITGGQVGIQLEGTNKHERKIVGRIKKLNVEKVNVSLAHAKVIQPLLQQKNWRSRNKPPRYEVSLSYGQRLEPWINDIQEIKKLSNE